MLINAEDSGNVLVIRMLVTFAASLLSLSCGYVGSTKVELSSCADRLITIRG